MAMSFFRRSGPSNLDHIQSSAVAMLADARHSFDLATSTLLTGVAPEEVAEDIRTTDSRINQAEQDLRAELVVHATVQGPGDIGWVLGFILLLKKIERIGDQAKNILDLSEGGVSFTGADDLDTLRTEQREVSSLFTQAGQFLLSPEDPGVGGFVDRVSELMEAHQTEIDGYMHSDRPGHEVVPRAIYYRYLKRIVANLRGVVGVALDPLPHIDYLDGGQTDTDD